MKNSRFQLETKLALLHFFEEKYCDANDLETDSVPCRNSATTYDDNEDNFKDEIKNKIENLQLENKDLKPVLSPVKETVRCLRKIADELQGDYEQRIDRSCNAFFIGPETYKNFSSKLDDLWKSTPEDTDWKMVSTVMFFSWRCAQHLSNKGVDRLNRILDFTTTYLEDVAADFIVNNGGWANIPNE